MAAVANVNTQLLIDAIVRQTIVLIAQLAAAGGLRAQLSRLANQVLVEPLGELNAQGMSRSVCADMFGMALRAYIGKLQRLNESFAERSQSLWQAILDFIESKPVVNRAEVCARFHHDEPMTVRSILHDLAETGLVSSSGTEDSTVFRAIGEEEARHAHQHTDGADELLAMRHRVETFNAKQPLPDEHTRVVCYAGQHLIPQSSLDEADH